MGDVLFLYFFEFVPFENPPQTMDRFSEDLKAYFDANRLGYMMSALGGMVACRGIVFGKGRPVADEDQKRLAEWAGRQHVRCTGRLGALELEREDIEYFRPVTEWVFAIDNLTDEDRAEAAARHENIRQWVETLHRI